MAIIGLYGGSFNPPHLGHKHVLKTSKEIINADEIWMMVSPGNPLKDPATYAPLPDRLNMCKIMTRNERDWLKPTDLEKHLETNETADTLDHLAKKFPQHKFVWIMGADNLTDFHKWQRWEHIIDNFPILIIPRPGKNKEALSSRVAFQCAALQLSTSQDLSTADRGWYFHRDKIRYGAAASDILRKLRSGQRNIPDLDPYVENYIFKRDLYNIPKTTLRAHQPKI